MRAESIHTPRRRSCPKNNPSFSSPITIHNFQKALAVGVAFGAWLAIQVQKPLSGRLVWPLGLACKIPEGAALFNPNRTDGKSRLNAFLYWGSIVSHRRAHREPS